ncbi:hypothetical protein DL98DRAFT_304728 [Cadophora sp. DSE1049]|nr:hypothetical protein DL98DRAFT_304728 [Cadophora sp. DSE1049]
MLCFIAVFPVVSINSNSLLLRYLFSAPNLDTSEYRYLLWSSYNQEGIFIPAQHSPARPNSIMPPLKPNTIRTLRSKLPAQTPRISAVHRSLTVTAKNATSIEPRKQPSHATPIISPQSTRTPPSPPQIPQNSPSDFDTLLNALTHHLTTTPKPHLPTLHTFLRSYTSSSTEWSKYAHANPTKQYTRNLITSVPGIFNLLLLVWTPGMRSPIHDHADSHCLMKIMKGSLRESRFAMPVRGKESGRETGGEGLREIARTDFKENKVAYISDKLGLHEILNPSLTEYAVSLHR